MMGVDQTGLLEVKLDEGVFLLVFCLFLVVHLGGILGLAVVVVAQCLEEFCYTVWLVV